MVRLRRHCDLLRHPRPGVILPLVLVTLAIAIILGMCFLTSAATTTQLSAAVDHRLRARMIAESGLAAGLAYLERDHNDWRTARPNGEWVASCEMDGGTFTLFGEDGDQLDAANAVVGDGSLTDDASDPVMLSCVGVYKGARHVARAVRYPALARGISVSERIEVRDTALIDSFDRKRPYAAATATNAALAQSNGVAIDPYIKLRNTATVNGNVYFAPGGSAARAVQVQGTSAITGTIGALPAPVTMARFDEPLWLAAGTGVNRLHSTGLTILSSDLWCDDFTLNGDATLRVVDDVKLYVGNKMTVTDNARIEIGSPVAYGATIKNSISLNTSRAIDSYDSAVAGYGGENVGSQAVLATISTAPAAVTVASTVKGDIYSGVGSVPATTIVGAGTVTGARAAMTAPLSFPAPVAMPNNFPPSMPHRVVRDISYTVNTDLQLDSVEIGGNGFFRINGHRRVRINGDFIFTGNGVIDIPAGSSLTMYVGGRILVTGESALANTGFSPPRFRIFGTGSGLTHKIAGRADLYAIIDAPGSAIEMEDDAEVYGAIIASSLTMIEHSALHNDRNPALLAANPRLPAGWTTGSKLTVYTNRTLAIAKQARVNPGLQNPLSVSFRHLSAEPMKVTDDAQVYAEAHVPQSTLTITSNSTNKSWTGRIEARHLSIGGKAIVTADASGGATRPGIAVEETVEISGQAQVFGTGGAALLASNGRTDGSIWIKDAAVFKGDGYTAPGGNPGDEIRVAPAATFTGMKSALALPVPIAALTPPPITAAISHHVYTSTMTATISGQVHCDNFRVMGNARVEVEGRTEIVMTGNLTFADDARLVLRPGATLTIHCPGRVLIAGRARVNLDEDPARLIISCPEASEVVVSGDAPRVSAILLAPQAELKLTDSAEFYGAFTGRRLTVDNTAKFHCANGLIGPITWIEQR